MTVQTAFRLDSDLLDRLKAVSAEEGRTQTWYVNKALSEYFGKPEKPKVSKPSIIEDVTAEKVISYLNAKAGTKYRNAESNKKLVNARLKDYQLKDLCFVIDNKCNEWKGTEFEKYLRPSTLFNATKFENYVNEKVIPNGNRPRQNTKETPEQRLSRLSKEMGAKRATSGDHGEILGENGSVVSTQVAQLSGGSY